MYQFKVPWEVFATRSGALAALTDDPMRDLIPSTRIATPECVVVEVVCGVMCVRYDKQWSLHYDVLQPLLRSLPLQLDISRVLLDFLNQNHIGTASYACIFSLYRGVAEMNGRFALCNLNEDMLNFFLWHDKGHLIF